MADPRNLANLHQVKQCLMAAIVSWHLYESCARDEVERLDERRAKVSWSSERAYVVAVKLSAHRLVPRRLVARQILQRHVTAIAAHGINKRLRPVALVDMFAHAFLYDGAQSLRELGLAKDLA